MFAGIHGMLGRINTAKFASSMCIPDGSKIAAANSMISLRCRMRPVVSRPKTTYRNLSQSIKAGSWGFVRTLDTGNPLHEQHFVEQQPQGGSDGLLRSGPLRQRHNFDDHAQFDRKHHICAAFELLFRLEVAVVPKMAW
jgi:hypothetical protein